MTMKKNILATAIVAMGIALSAPSFAQENSSIKMTPPPTDSPQSRQMAHEHCPLQADLFDGIELSDKQRGELEKYCKERAEKQHKNAEKYKNDRKKAAKGLRKKYVENRKKDLKKYKDILTPEQYIKFLENNYLRGRGEMRPMYRTHHEKRSGLVEGKKLIRDESKITVRAKNGGKYERR